MADFDLSSLTDYASSLLTNTQNTANVNAINSKVKSVSKDSSEDELLDACKQFESYLWEQILKEVDKSVNLFGTSSEGSYAANMVNTFSDQMIQDLSDKLTSGGGTNSMAMQLYEQLKRNYGIDSITPEQIDAKEQAEKAAEAGLVSEEVDK